jgi:hypothetical protein
MEWRTGYHVQIEVRPMRIVFLYQSDLPIASPSLELLLKADRLGHFAKATEEDEPVNAVGCRKALRTLRLVLSYATLKAVGDANVKGSKLLAGQDVDPIAVVPH